MSPNSDPALTADIPARLAAVHRRIRAAELRFGRAPGSVMLLAVSKRHPPAAIRAAAATGQRDFGENYVDEAAAKQQALAELPLAWHFVGPIQSNKTRTIASSFAWVHSVDREKILRRLADQRPEGLPPLNCLLQVRIGGEESKAGVDPAGVEALADAATGHARLTVRGLMCIPPPERGFDAQRRWLAELRRLYEELDPARRGWDTLSMGMSADLEAAIAEGSTLVRVGTDIFGPRP